MFPQTQKYFPELAQIFTGHSGEAVNLPWITTGIRLKSKEKVEHSHTNCVRVEEEKHNKNGSNRLNSPLLRNNHPVSLCI